MRDLIAGVVALALLVAAASLATTLQSYRRRRNRRRDRERVLGRTIIAEIPASDDLLFFSEDDRCFYYGERTIDKSGLLAARVLINGSPIAAALSSRIAASAQPTSFEDRPEGIARDRWDVALETFPPGGEAQEVILIECGAIRERVSQELARTVFDACKRAIDLRDPLTTPTQSRPPAG